MTTPLRALKSTTTLGPATRADYAALFRLTAEAVHAMERIHVDLLNRIQLLEQRLVLGIPVAEVDAAVKRVMLDRDKGWR